MWKPCVGDTMTGADWSSTGRREDSVANNGLDGLHSIRHLSEGKREENVIYTLATGNLARSTGWWLVEYLPVGKITTAARHSR